MMPAIRVLFVRHQKETQSAHVTDRPSIASSRSDARYRCIRASVQQHHPARSRRCGSIVEASVVLAGVLCEITRRSRARVRTVAAL